MSQERVNGMTTIEPMNAMRWRCIGPPRGGRVVAVAGDPEDPAVFYFGACAGGVWKTSDAGTYWENVSDGFFRTSAVGAIAVADSDHNVIYAGMGESCIRGDVSYGDGVYRSTDGGKTWTHLGLEDTRHIARIRVHPEHADIVYVAALGHAFGPNSQRGVLGPMMVESRGIKCCSSVKKPAPSTSPWMRQIPESYTQRCGKPTERRGVWLVEAPAAGFTNLLTAGIPGKN